MYNVRSNIQASPGQFRMENRWFRYSSFVPRLYNWCKTLGFEAGKIMPSRAFCSDESQGYPIILLTKHFGTFPFDHGRVGGIMSTGRHGPHAHHGQDLVIVQASHVGYLPDSGTFGQYGRFQTEDAACSTNCGKIHGVLDWYCQAYEFACNHIFVEIDEQQCQLTIDNQYLLHNHERALVLHLDKMVDTTADGQMIPLATQSTSRTFAASAGFTEHLRHYFSAEQGRQAIGTALQPEFFTYRSASADNHSGIRELETNLLGAMPWIVTSAAPMLTAAQVNTQAEFDHAHRSIAQEPAYQGKNLLYVTGLHVDISPEAGQLFPLTKFIPWAAYQQLADGTRKVLEQEELFATLQAASPENPDQIDLDVAIEIMEGAQEVQLKLPA